MCVQLLIQMKNYQNDFLPEQALCQFSVLVSLYRWRISLQLTCTILPITSNFIYAIIVYWTWMTKFTIVSWCMCYSKTEHLWTVWTLYLGDRKRVFESISSINKGHSLFIQTISNDSSTLNLNTKRSELIFGIIKIKANAKTKPDSTQVCYFKFFRGAMRLLR